MVFCGVTSWFSAILLLWTAGNWEENIVGILPLYRTISRGLN